MSLIKVKEYFKKFGMDNRIIELNTSSATVQEASQALLCAPGMIAKSLLLLLNNKPILVILAGDKKIDNGKFKTAFNEKTQMIKAIDVEKLVGHKVGGVCPFAINFDVKVYLDESLKAYEYVYPACGSANSAIKLTINELEKYSNMEKWVDIAK